ncbi:MAG TPA: LysM peptidoglycan-binding domain-containing protein [Phycisphaerae bacterium]|nr:LysM peptidoglycan-binding domain-containing protein [Phycisphaerae bacterium]
MTKETKIGLLVGLAFIILFAIILSEKGTPQRSTASFTVADGSKPASPLGGSEQPLGSAGRLQVTSQLPPIVQPKPQQVTIAPPSAPVAMSEELVTQAAPKKDESIAPLPEAVVKALNSIPIKDESRGKSDGGALEPQSAPKSVITTPSLASAEKANAEPAITPPASTTEMASVAPTSPPAPKPTPEKPPVIRTVHTVQSGESLGKIAAKYYGRSTPARIEAIFKANRDRLKATHQVKAEQKLDIPDLGEANSAFEPVTVFSMSDFSAVKAPPSTSDAIRIPIPIRESAATAGPGLRKLDTQAPTIQTASVTTASKKNKSADASYQWYEVRPKDTLSRIARKMLGSEKHTSELFKLNKDRMANKNSLKPGMKLRIPVKSAAMLEPQTAVSSSGFEGAD